jgi:hypothetical protein
LKTDGEFIYTVSGQILSIVKAYPTTQTKVMSTIVLKAYPQSMFIDRNYLTVFGTDYETDPNPINPVDPVGPIKPIPLN